MDMHAAALPARYGRASTQDEAHSRFGEYRTYRSAMLRLMVDSSDFSDWLSSVEREERLDAEATHPRFKTWQTAFIAASAGMCKMLSNGKPNAFPANFRYWLETGKLT